MIYFKLWKICINLISNLFVCLIWLLTSKSTIFQLCRNGSLLVQPVLSKDIPWGYSNLLHRVIYTHFRWSTMWILISCSNGFTGSCATLFFFLNEVQNNVKMTKMSIVHSGTLHIQNNTSILYDAMSLWLCIVLIKGSKIRIFKFKDVLQSVSK